MNIAKNGVWPVMLTPFTKDLQIDYPALKELIRWYEDGGAAGLFAVCGSSEIFYLSRSERLKLAEFVVEHARVPVVAVGNTEGDLDAQIDECREMAARGVSQVVLLSSRIAGELEDEDTFVNNTLRFFNALEDTTFGFYEIPSPYKRILQPDTLERLARMGKVSFFKDTCLDIGMMEQKAALCRNTPLRLFNAEDASLLESLRNGASGYCGVGANFGIKPLVWLCENYADETQRERVEAVSRMLTARSATELICYPSSAKVMLGMRGLSIKPFSRAVNCGVLLGSSHNMRMIRAMLDIEKDYGF